MRHRENGNGAPFRIEEH